MFRSEGFRVGVVGAGYWGSKHVRAMRSVPGVDTVTVIDPSEDRVASVQRSIPGLRSAKSLAEALDDIDGVVIATPPSLHAPLALQAIEAGKHVLVEKPLATTVRDARTIKEAAQARGVVAMVGHTFEYHAAVKHLREMIERGDLGRLFYLETSRLNMGLYQHDVNVMWDLAPHDLSILNYVLGGTPTSIEAWGSRHAHRRLEDVVHLRVAYDDPNVEATIHVSWLHPRKTRVVTAVGSNAMVVFDDLAEDRIRVHDKAVQEPDEGVDDLTQPPMSYRYGAVVAPYLVVPEPLALEDEHLVDCAMTGLEPVSGADSGLAVVEALEAAQLSLREGRRVALAEVRGTDAPHAGAPLAAVPSQRTAFVTEAVPS